MRDKRLRGAWNKLDCRSCGISLDGFPRGTVFCSLVCHFWSNVDRRGDDECWPYLRNISKAGYGIIKHLRVQFGTHVVAASLDGRAPEPGQVVRHSCDNPPCVNPAHLLVGTHAENVADKIARGRDRSPRGEAHFRARLTEAMVVEARLHRGSLRALAALRGVPVSSLRSAAGGTTWAHVETPPRRGHQAS